MHTNRLANEKSPYLLQHRHNPVSWYPWGEEAFRFARDHDRPIFLSIGYSTCYWCHVMEKDSFEDEEVAAVLNHNFVCIKVDREERPDVDGIYMKAVVTLSGHGGWPLSVFLTPDLKPFYGGTFFRKEQFILLLEKIAEAWDRQRSAVNHTAEQLTEALRNEKVTAQPSDADERLLTAAFEYFSRSFDSHEAGFGTAPKFPPSSSLRLLLRYHHRTGNTHALRMVTETLEKMACGGIFDQLGGGFHRYSTDAKWLVPHFEKMLYDNALLASTYLEAYRLTTNELFADVARRTLDYVIRDMTSAEGGFFSAEDAGEVDREGEFYVWGFEELSQLLNEEELGRLRGVFGVSEEGNFEERNILHLKDAASWFERNEPVLASALEKLNTARRKRPRPHRDDKILASWNGLMIAAFALGYRVLGDHRYLQAARRSAQLVRSRLMRDGRLFRSYCGGEAKVPAFVDDYAFLVHGLLELAQADLDEAWLRWAVELQDATDTLFWDDKEKGYFYSADEEKSLIAKQKEFFDDAEPAANSIAALNLLRLYDLTADDRYRERADEIFRAPSELLRKYPAGFASLLMALDYRLDRSKEVAVIGPSDSSEAKLFLEKLGRGFFPNAFVACSASEPDQSAFPLLAGKTKLDGKTTFYVCERGACRAPTNDPVAALALVAERRMIG